MALLKQLLVALSLGILQWCINEVAIKVFIHKITKQKQGSALVMALMAIVGIGVLTTIVMQANRIEKNISTKSQADNDVARATAMIASIFVTPADCNANFKNIPRETATLTDIRKCPSGTCSGNGGVIALNGNNWTMFAGEPPAKAKLNTVQLTLSPQVVGQPITPGVITARFSFTKNVGFANGKIVTAVSRDFTAQAFVNTATYDGAGSITQTPNINGCVRSPSSTTVY